MTLRNSDAVSRNLNNRTSVLLAGDQIEELREKFVKVMTKKNNFLYQIITFRKGLEFLKNMFIHFFEIIALLFVE